MRQRKRSRFFHDQDPDHPVIARLDTTIFIVHGERSAISLLVEDDVAVAFLWFEFSSLVRHVAIFDFAAVRRSSILFPMLRTCLGLAEFFDVAEPGPASLQ